jgi:hypothetical protein
MRSLDLSFPEDRQVLDPSHEELDSSFASRFKAVVKGHISFVQREATLYRPDKNLLVSGIGV